MLLQLSPSASLVDRILIPVVVGPIAKTVEDCALFMKSALVPKLFESDRNTAPLPFDDKAYRSKAEMKIGYFDSDGWFEPCVTVKRAISETVVALRKAGHTVERFSHPTDGWYNYGLVAAINAAEGNFRSFVDALEGEQIVPEYNALLLASNLPNLLRPLVLRLLEPRRAHLLAQTRSGGLTVMELWQKTAELAEMRSKWSNGMSENDFDAVIYPSMPLPAFKHGVSGQMTSSCSYMVLSNLLLWPCGCLPITTIRADEAHYTHLSMEKGLINKLATETMEGSQGLPISISVMTTAYQDEKCLRAMKEIERLVQFTSRPQAFNK